MGKRLVNFRLMLEASTEGLHLGPDTFTAQRRSASVATGIPSRTPGDHRSHCSVSLADI